MKGTFYFALLALIIFCSLDLAQSFRLRRENVDYGTLVPEPNDPMTYSRATYRKFMLDIFRSSNKGKKSLNFSNVLDDPNVEVFMERISKIVDDHLDYLGLNYFALADILADTNSYVMQKMLSEYNSRYGNNEL